MEQSLINIKIPTTCKECFNSPFKKPRPNCWYEKAYHLQKSVKFFKEELDMDLGIDIETALSQLKPLCKQCLKTIDQRAKEIQQQEFMKEINNTIMNLKEEVEELKNFKERETEREETPIYKQQKDVEAPIRVVKKNIPEIKIQTIEKSGEKQPHGGWKIYQRNVRPENLKKYLQELKNRKSELSDEIDKAIDGKETPFIDISYNKNGNYIVKYRDLK